MDIILHLTHDCQLQCVYCYGGRRREGRMMWETAQRALDLFFDQPILDPAVKPQICFFGGEPLLEWPLLERCVSYSQERSARTHRPYRLALDTNGLLLDDEKAEYLAANGVDVVLSFDGVREAQDAARPTTNGRSSFDGTLRALNVATRHFKDFGVCAVVSPPNVQYLPAGVDFLLGNGVRRRMLNPDFFSNWADEGLNLWRKGYEHAAMRFQESFERGRPINMNLFMAKIITHLKKGYEKSDCCLFGLSEIAIAPSGRIYPCQRMVGEDTMALGLMGDVFKGIDPPAAKALDTCRSATSPECAACDIRHRCRNWCSCVNHALTGRYDTPGPLICFHEKMVVELADQVASRLFAKKVPSFIDTFYRVGAVSPEWI